MSMTGFSKETVEQTFKFNISTETNAKNEHFAYILVNCDFRITNYNHVKKLSGHKQNMQ